jgi:prepilin signal peptidase PulO-like enzyme (type II secretory pathway)
MLLPNRIVYPLIAVCGLGILAQTILFGGGLSLIFKTVISVAISGGIFYALFQISKGKWIGGGDVKLGYAIGLLLSDPIKAMLMLFLASLIGLVVSFPFMVAGKTKLNSRIPFGPFLIVGAVISFLYGASIISWYEHTFILM